MPQMEDKAKQYIYERKIPMLFEVGYNNVGLCSFSKSLSFDLLAFSFLLLD